MANLPETPQWQDGIYQIETSDPVLGGPDGISNRQAKQLASRTAYLKQQQEKSDTALDDHIAAADPHKQYAPKVSPTLTGTPTAPTAVQTTNNTQIATTAFVQANVLALKGGAPADMDTLKKLADAANSKLTKDQNLSDLPNKSAARGALELGTAATKDAGKSAGNVMINGDFGIGGDTPILSSTNTLTVLKSQKTGKYAVNSGSADMPVSSLAYEFDWSLTSSSSNGYGVLIAKALADRGVANNRIYRNALRNGVWQGWVMFYDEDNKPSTSDIGALDRMDFPVGIPQPWPTATAPAGWLKCNGAGFDKAKYPLLAIAFPSGKLPDLRGEFIRGWDDGRGIDPNRGVGSFQAATGISPALGGFDFGGGIGIDNGESGVWHPTYSRYSVTGSVGDGVEYKTVRPRNIAFNYIVRAA